MDIAEDNYVHLICIHNLSSLFPPPDATMRPGIGLKSYEDCIDALVCAWVGYQIISGKAKAYGDDVSAIWVPEDQYLESPIMMLDQNSSTHF